MGFYYEDVAIYSDSMIYSNLRCFYLIKFIFAQCRGDVESISESDFLMYMNIESFFSPFTFERDLSPFCDKCEYL